MSFDPIQLKHLGCQDLDVNLRGSKSSLHRAGLPFEERAGKVAVRFLGKGSLPGANFGRGLTRQAVWRAGQNTCDEVKCY